MKTFPLFDETKTADLLKFIVRERNNTDVQQFNNLANVFISGRKVGKIPTGSSDVAATDRVGDVNWDADYIYILIDDTPAAWRRATLGAW